LATFNIKENQPIINENFSVNFLEKDQCQLDVEI